jgi:uncharacterized protein
MKCPIDGAPLTMTERQGIEIDYCPTCRGVWLDRGELDKIVERSQAEGGAGVRDDRRRHGDDDDRDEGEERRPARPGKPGVRSEHRAPPEKRRESLLGELFDF